MLQRSVIGLLGLLLVPASGTLAAQTPGAQAAGGSPQQALVKQYCTGCHNQRAKVGGLALDTLDAGRPTEHPEIWEKVIRKVKAGLMPPAGQRRPAKPAVDGLVTFLETELDKSSAAAPNPGRTEAFHRLNRAEYRNAIRDIFDLDIDINPFLPADDASFGFDNIAGVLKISQSRLEQYLSAGRKVARAAIGTPLPAPAAQEFRVPETLQQYEHIEGLPFGTRGGMSVRFNFPQDGEYDVAIDLLCRVGGECDGSAGFPDEHQMEVLVDGERVKLFTLESRRDFRPPQERTWHVRVAVKAGPRDVAATFLKLPSVRETDSSYERFQRPYYLNGIVGRPQQTIYQPFLDRITISGPLTVTGVSDTPSRKRIFVC